MAAAEPDQMPHAVPDRLEIVVCEQGTTTTVTLGGEWDLAERDATRQAIRGALARSPECVVLDLSRLTFNDSSGIHVLRELQERAAAQNIRLVIVPGPRGVQRLFEICGLATALPFRTAAE